MTDKFYKTLIIIFYTMSFLILLFCIKVGLTPNMYLTIKFKLILMFFVCLFVYLSGYILVKKLEYTKKILKINMIIYFLIYVLVICSLTLFDEIFGRQGFVIIKWNKELLDTYLSYFFNIVPFKTIKLFTNGYINQVVSFKNFCINIIGNLCAFMPCGIFLPLMFKKLNKYHNFLFIMIISVILIEILQFITLSGSCDIDDLILNVVGASIIYFICKIKVVNKIAHKIFFFE